MFDHRVKLLEYRRLNRRSCFLSHVGGPLVTKKGLRTKETETRLREQFKKEVKLWCWKYAPRAKLAVSFRFFDSERNHPGVQSLVKFYLDTLQGIVFEDDRQVHYLEAAAWRLLSNGEESSVFIRVQRLPEYERYVELASEAGEGEDEEWNYLFHPYCLDERHWAIAERQYEVLSKVRILSHNRRARKLKFPASMDLFRDAHPFIFDFGGLPEVEGTSAFKNRIRKTLGKYTSSGFLFSHVYVPIELNAQITKQGLKLGKDLDNVMRLVCPIIQDTLLHCKSYINGYRAYVLDDELSPPRLSIQLLSVEAIEAYNKKLEAGFEAYGAGLD